MLLLGAAMGMFVMSWHITTFIIHSKRMPFIGATRQSFLKFCINNSLLPLGFFIYYSAKCIEFQRVEEQAPWLAIVFMQLGFYLGFLLMIVASFSYFFRVGRDLLKTVLATITNPSHVREIIPYDGLDLEFDMIQADTYLTETLGIEHIDKLEKYHPRLLNTVLRRHHRNAISATIFALTILLLLGIFMEEPLLRIPAGAGFLMLFAVLMGIVGAVKYFLRSWEIFGWVILLVLMGWMVQRQMFDMRSIAYGLDYKTENNVVPTYNYEQLKKTFTPGRYDADKVAGISQLDHWRGNQGDSLPPIVIVTVSGGGSRSAYWTFRALQYVDSLTNGNLFKRSALLTGASGGMLGAAYWRSIHSKAGKGDTGNVYAARYQEAIGKDLFNAIIFSFVSVDLISPFNKVSLGPYSYTKDRGYAMEQDLIRNTEGALGGRLGDYAVDERNGLVPHMIVNGSIVNDGRKLLMSAQPVGYLTRPFYALSDTSTPQIDAVDFATLFAQQNPYNLRIATALRMNATFPFVLPVVKLPSKPIMNVMDAGLRDNFGTEVGSRWLYVFKDWLKQNTREIIWLQIRDTREHDILPPSTQEKLGAMLGDPLFVIQNKWEPFQSHAQSYIKDLAPEAFGGKLRFVTLQYVARRPDKIAKLNFHLTQQEKEDLYHAVYQPRNKAEIDTLVKLLR